MVPSLLGASGATTPAPVLLLSGGSMVDFDRTLFIVALIFVALMLVLEPLIFQPLLKLFEEREQRTDGARTEARKMQERAGKLLRRYEKRLAKAHAAVELERAAARQETAKLEAEILEGARVASEAVVAAGRAAIAEQVSKVRQELDGRRAQLARDVASAALGREVRG